MRYICTESFSVEMFDIDGFSEDRYLDIEKGEIYESTDDDFRMIGGADTIRLESENGNWLELQQETIDRYFDKAEEGE